MNKTMWHEETERPNAPRRANQPRALRLLAGGSGVVIGAALMTAVTALFGGASTMPWLAPTEANAALLAHCGALAGTAPRRDCTQAVIAAVQMRQGALRLAAASQP